MNFQQKELRQVPKSVYRDLLTLRLNWRKVSKTPFIVSIRVVNSKINLFAPKQKDLRVLYLLYSSLLTKKQSQWGSAGYTEGSN